MASMPVPVNKNLNRNNTPTPIAGTGEVGGLGGVKVDGTSIVIDASTAIISTGGGGSGIGGSGTAGTLPIFTAPTVIGDSPLTVAPQAGIDTLNSDDIVSLYPTLPTPQGNITILDVESFGVSGGISEELDLIYATDQSTPGDLSAATIRGLYLDMFGLAGGENDALYISDSLPQGADNFAIRSDSTAQSQLAGDLQMQNSALRLYGSATSQLNIFALNSGIIQFFDVHSAANAMAFKIGLDSPVANLPSVLLNLLTIEGLSADPATGGLDDGTIWYNSTAQQYRTWVNGNIQILTPAKVNITPMVTLTGAALVNGAAIINSGSSAIRFSAIPQNYKHLVLEWTGKGAAGAGSAVLTFNNDTGTHYATRGMYTLGTSNPATFNQDSQAGIYGLQISSSTGASSGRIKVPSYANTNFQKQARMLLEVSESIASSANDYNIDWHGYYNQTTAIASMELTAGVTFADHSEFTLYGIS